MKRDSLIDVLLITGGFVLLGIAVGILAAVVAIATGLAP